MSFEIGFSRGGSTFIDSDTYAMGIQLYAIDIHMNLLAQQVLGGLQKSHKDLLIFLATTQQILF